MNASVWPIIQRCLLHLWPAFHLMNESQNNSFHRDKRWKRKEVASLEGRPFCWQKVCLQGSLFNDSSSLINCLDPSCVPAPLLAAVMHLSGLHRQWNHSQTCSAYIFFFQMYRPRCRDGLMKTIISIPLSIFYLCLSCRLAKLFPFPKHDAQDGSTLTIPSGNPPPHIFVSSPVFFFFFSTATPLLSRPLALH